MMVNLVDSLVQDGNVKDAMEDIMECIFHQQKDAHVHEEGSPARYCVNTCFNSEECHRRIIEEGQGEYDDCVIEK